MRTLAFVPTDPTVGLYALTSTKFNFDRDPGQVFRLGRPMRVHPLGLDLPPPGEFGDNLAFLQVGSDKTVGLMAAVINRSVGGATVSPLFERLRIINVQCHRDQPKDHFCYFELWIWGKSYLCGDCTDCSGAGGHANRQMRGVFTLISSLYAVAVEEVELPYNEDRNLWTLGMRERELA